MKKTGILHLIEKAISPASGGVWVDLGSGEGAFTFALRELGGPSMTIYSVEKDPSRLRTQINIFKKESGAQGMHFLNADFTKAIQLPRLNGALMANTLHFVADQTNFLKKLHKTLKPKGKLLLVEYEMDYPTPFVPHPLPFETFNRLAIAAGFNEPEFLAAVPSRYGGRMYSALARK